MVYNLEAYKALKQIHVLDIASVPVPARPDIIILKKKNYLIKPVQINH